MKADVETVYLGIVQTARDNVMNAIKSRRDVADATAHSIAGLFAGSEWDAAAPRNAVAGAVASGAVAGACELGAGLNRVANGILRGAMISGEERDEPMLDVIKQTSNFTIRAVAGLDGDVAGAMAGLLDAASDGAASKGITEESAASAAGDGGLLGTHLTSPDNKQLVREAITAHETKTATRAANPL